MMRTALSLILTSVALPNTADPTIRIAALGDSLTAGYGLAASDGFAPRLEMALREQGYQVVVENAGVSGDTSAGGLRRLELVLSRDPDLVIVELGANDALRGLNPELTEKNLGSIIKTLKDRDVKVVLAGMRAPPNMGSDYVTRFDSIYPRLARQHNVTLYPFFLDGVALKPQLNQADGIHPTAEGISRIVEKIRPTIEEMIQTVLLKPTHKH